MLNLSDEVGFTIEDGEERILGDGYRWLGIGETLVLGSEVFSGSGWRPVTWELEVKVSLDHCYRIGISES